jgi:hypothetical protein
VGVSRKVGYHPGPLGDVKPDHALVVQLCAKNRRICGDNTRATLLELPRAETELKINQSGQDICRTNFCAGFSVSPNVASVRFRSFNHPFGVCDSRRDLHCFQSEPRYPYQISKVASRGFSPSKSCCLAASPSMIPSMYASPIKM